ncbi:MMPL family transporter [Embleya hyalina]|uniref:Membrane protein n=1 Tax=Embleya hyalina TaxID=516124 RepID=A0A401Z6P5_9ACTN|nr:MMPL family transporter [Embleya hyalina]GCE02537.1 membrane protein [Embleya hyalina]
MPETPVSYPPPGVDPGAPTPARADHPSVFERIASWAHRRRKAALLTWVAVLIAVSGIAMAIGSDFHNDFSLPGTESQQAADTLKRHGATQAGDSVQIVLHDKAPVSAPATRERVERMLGAVRELPHVAEVRSPYDDANAVSRDGLTAYATVTLDGVGTDVPKDAVTRIIDTAQAAETSEATLRVELGGDQIRGAQESGGGAAEGAGMIGALVVLVFLFGSLVAAAVPLLTAVFAVGSTLGLVVLASHVADIADFTPPVMMLVGLGVGVDYALLIFSRYRAELLRGADTEQATRRALDTAGRTVFFAACTVIIALLGLVTLGLGSLRGVALAVALTVLMTMLASLTLLPALLGLFGKRIRRNVERRAAKSKTVEGTRWRSWAARVQRRPWLALIVPVVALVGLAAPAVDMRLGFADAGNDAAAKTSRQAYDLLADGFGPGFNGPLFVVVEGDAGAAERTRGTLEGTPGIAAVSPILPSRDPRVSTVIAYPTSAPQDEATTRLVEHLREDVMPGVERGTGATVLVGGGTAAVEDFAAKVADRLPLFVVIVVGLSFVLLLLVFRSILVPLKAALLNLLSIGAAMGVITLVFQYGLFGVQEGPIEAFIPVMIFAIVFGLSMDYEVFLLARVHEEWRRTRDAGHAVREGLATTGKVITAAAAIMIVVFGAFVLSEDRMLQQFGLGLAVAILLDALVIRCLIVPAVMRLFGARAWWLPRRLDRALPRIALEHD